MQEALLKKYETMNASAQQELYDFALFLISKNNKNNSVKRHAGIAKDPDFYMAPDFDAPLEDFAEYM